MEYWRGVYHRTDNREGKHTVHKSNSDLFHLIFQAWLLQNEAYVYGLALWADNTLSFNLLKCCDNV